MRSIGTVALTGALVAGCASAPTRSTGALPPLPTTATTAGPSPTTAARPVTKRAVRAATVRPAPGYTDTTPPPAIRATGTDYAAIAHSLMNYKDWLLEHHPDPALAVQVFAPGTVTSGRLIAEVTAIRNQHQTIASVDLRLTFTVVTVRTDLVTLQMRETLVEDRTFDRDHHLVATQPWPGSSHYDILIIPDGTGRWRMGDITTVSVDPAIVITR